MGWIDREANQWHGDSKDRCLSLDKQSYIWCYRNCRSARQMLLHPFVDYYSYSFIQDSIIIFMRYKKTPTNYFPRTKTCLKYPSPRPGWFGHLSVSTFHGSLSYLYVSLPRRIHWTLLALQPDNVARIVQKSQETIHRIAGQLIRAKKQNVLQGTESGNDLLSLLRKLKFLEDHCWR